MYAGLYFAELSEEEAGLDAAELANEIVDVLVDHQAADVVLLDLTPLTTFTDFFVVASAESERQMRALVDAVDELLGAQEPKRRAKWEGQAANGWQLLDLGDLVVHLFSVEKRAYYDLEGLWAEAREVVHIQ